MTGHAPRPPQAKTVEKALHVLLHLAAARRDLGVHEVAEGVGLHPSTAYRLLAVLGRHHFVQAGGAPGRYRLGLRLAELGYAALDTLELRAKARPVLEQLAEETRETAHLMMLSGDAGVYVDRVESPQRIRVASSLGYREWLHGSAVGKAILAHLPPDRFARLAARRFPRLTPRTITETARLRRHLRDVAARGFAVDNEEGETGIRCVGAPVFDHRGAVVASISVSGPAYRLGLAQLAAWGPRLRQAGLELSTTLGYRPEAHPGRRARPTGSTASHARTRRR